MGVGRGWRDWIPKARFQAQGKLGRAGAIGIRKMTSVLLDFARIVC